MTHLGNAFHNICSHNNGVLLVEDAGWKDLEDAREDSIQLGSLLLMLLHLQRVIPSQKGMASYWAALLAQQATAVALHLKSEDHR